jgi:prefoldin subunit 4
MNINAFSKLNSRADEVADRVVALRQELEDLEEVETEMELMDEDEVIL